MLTSIYYQKPFTDVEVGPSYSPRRRETGVLRVLGSISRVRIYFEYSQYFWLEYSGYSEHCTYLGCMQSGYFLYQRFGATHAPSTPSIWSFSTAHTPSTHEFETASTAVFLVLGVLRGRNTIDISLCILGVPSVLGASVKFRYCSEHYCHQQPHLVVYFRCWPMQMMALLHWQTSPRLFLGHNFLPAHSLVWYVTIFAGATRLCTLSSSPHFLFFSKHNFCTSQAHEPSLVFGGTVSKTNVGVETALTTVLPFL